MRRNTVLLVEDQPDNRIIYTTILEHAGYAVLEAQNGEEGVRRAREHAPDLVLMDLSMPVMDGWGAVRELKRDPTTASIPVCALSAHVLFPGDLERVRSAGFECYLTKPLEPRRVLEEVEKRIGPADGRRAA
jgi:two-component system, cell cycle response regulator DivK